MILTEYRETRFEPVCDSLPQDFHIVTACNPRGEIVSVEENIGFTDSLQRVLESLEVTYFPIHGGSPDGMHREEGYAIPGISRDDAVALGRLFGQNAIFEICDGVLSVIGCESGTVEEIGPFAGRIGFLDRL